MKRREFVGKTTMALSAFSIVPRHVLGGYGYTAPSDKLNIACVGVGGKGRVDVGGVSSENIIALCDVDQVRAQELTRYDKFDKNAYDAYPKAKRYEDYREMLDVERDIDAITVSTPDHLHAFVTMAAMKKGINVYTQKPLTRTVDESRKILEFAKKAGVATQMGNQGHSNPGSRILNELIWEGKIGNVKEVHCWTDRPVWPQGISARPEVNEKVPATLNWDLWLGPTPHREYSSSYVPFAWRAWWDFGAGALGDMGCHILDYPFWALKLKAPTSVEAYSSPIYTETAPNSSLITYDFISGLNGESIKVKWYDGGLKPNVPKGLITDRDLWEKGSGTVFIGDEGILVYGHHRPKPILVVNGKEKEYKMPKEAIPRSIGHYKEWIAEIKGVKNKAASNFEYAGPLNETVLLGNVAIRAGKPLEWDSENLNITNNPEANKYLKARYRDGWEL